MTEHYFSPAPNGPRDFRELDLTLRGTPVRVRTSSGVFSGDRIDLGTRVLLDAVDDPPPTGRLADVGCGWGPIALAMAQASPEAEVWAVDVNRRAVELTAHNAASLGLAGVRALDADVAAERIRAEDARFEEIWSNPPIRIGKVALHELLRTWLVRLTPEGRALLVVQRNLGADSLHHWLESDLAMPTTRVASSKGFRVLEVRPS